MGKSRCDHRTSSAHTISHENASGRTTDNGRFLRRMVDVLHEDSNIIIATGTGPDSVNEEMRGKSLQYSIFCAALYMDHHYRHLLTPDQKYRARMQLCKISKRITGLQQNQCSSCNSESSAAPTSQESEGTLEAFSKMKEAVVGTQFHLTSESGSADIARLLEMLDKEPRIPKSTNVWHFATSAKSGNRSYTC